jgi:hypothetical protein
LWSRPAQTKKCEALPKKLLKQKWGYMSGSKAPVLKEGEEPNFRTELQSSTDTMNLYKYWFNTKIFIYKNHGKKQGACGSCL